MSERKYSINLEVMSKKSLGLFKQEQIGSNDGGNSNYPYIAKAILPYAVENRLDIFSFARGLKKNK
jgi:ABC-type uncharacterized transport system permease subunit